MGQNIKLFMFKLLFLILMFYNMASSLKNVSNSELIDEFRRRFIVFRWQEKDHIEALCNDGKEIDEEM